jgi:isopentenyl-diphosphate delta-isomerase
MFCNLKQIKMTHSQQNIDRNNIVLVNKEDQEIGTMDKLEAHQKGLLHRAFSVFLFNSKGEMLLQQRAENKYHGGGLWTNACCSHPQIGEDILQSAKNRLQFEMGISCDIDVVFSFIYQAQVENELIEHELDHVFVGFSDATPNPNSDEVKAFKWIQPFELLQEITFKPEKYTVWFKIAANRVIQEVSKRSYKTE